MQIKLGRQGYADALENGAAWSVALSLFVYGAIKPMQFGSTPEILAKPIGELTGMQLMWAFYGYSMPFAVVVGILEVIAAVLLMFPRVRLLGCLLASVILTNIVLQDIFYGVNQGALIAAIIYQALVLLVMWLRRAQLAEALAALIRPKAPAENKGRIFFLLQIAAAFIVFVLAKAIEYVVTHYEF